MTNAERRRMHAHMAADLASRCNAPSVRYAPGSGFRVCLDHAAMRPACSAVGWFLSGRCDVVTVRPALASERGGR